MILGIECTAHTFGIGIVDKGKVFANIRDMYKTEKGGIIPMESAKHHRAVAEDIYKKALETANINEKDIDAIAISNAPGLAPCLYAGMEFAKKLAEKLKVSLIPVNHCIAHLEIGRSVGAKDPVLLYTSGANTQVIAYAAGKYRIFGETLDIGVGNFLDKVGRHFGLGFPAGPEIEKLAKGGSYVELPYSIKGMDVSFSGMQTKLQQLYDKASDKEKIKRDLAFSMQETAFAMLIEAAERAMAHTGKKELVLGGGVACNSRLQEMCKIMCQERGAKFFCPERGLLVDNAAMIAFTGEIILQSKAPQSLQQKDLLKVLNSGIKESADKVEVKPRERTDEVSVSWR